MHTLYDSASFERHFGAAGAADDARLQAARQARGAGMPVIGLAGAVAPAELVLAAGAFPFALAGRAADRQRAADPMEDGHEPEVRSLFLQAVEGEFELCDLLVVPSASDGYRYLFQYLKEMQRQGRGERIPPLDSYDFLFGRSDPVRRYSRRVLQGLLERLSVLTGRTIADADLAAAVGRTNAVRAQVAALNALRLERHVDGAAAHQAIRAGGYLSPETHAAALAEWIAALENAPAGAARPKLLLVSAVPLYHEALHAACERAGATVAAEDDDWGARRGGPAIDIDAHGGAPLDAIFDYYARHAVSPRMLLEQREAWVSTQMASGRYHGVVFYIPPSDQFFGWRYPALRDLAGGFGLPAHLVRGDALDPADAGDIDSGLAAFAAQLAKDMQ